MADLTQENRQIELISPLGKDKLLLIGASITETLSELFRFDLEILSEDSNVDFESILGKQVTVKLALPNDKFRFFNGFVGHFKGNGTKDGLPYYTAQVHPWLWFLHHTHDCRIFQNKTVPDIIKQVFDDLEFNDVEFRLTAEYREWEYCVQYRESDFNFVSRLMEHEGIFYFFSHEEERHTLVLADSNASLESYEGFDAIPFSPLDASGVSITQECIRSLNKEKQLHPGSYTQRDFDFKVPMKDLTTLHSIARGHDRSGYEIYDYPGQYTETSHGDIYTRTRMEAVRTGYETISGESDARGVAGGYYFDLTGHPEQGYDKRYLVTSAGYHLSTSAGFQSGVSINGLGYGVFFNAIDFDTPYRPVMKTRKPVVEGPQTAIVSGPGGDEIYTDEYGRVKVQFHWDREGRRDENSSCWMRVSQAWAGKNWGAMYIPRIGQEVIVEFLEGDPDRPIITGRVYNGKSMPPYPLPDEKTKSTLKSNSSKGGEGFNEIRFEDKKNKEQVFFHAERNMDVHVKNDSFESIYGNRHQIIGNEDEGNQKEFVHGDKHFRVIGDRIGKVEGDDNLILDSNRIQSVAENENLTVNGDMLTQVDADYHLTIGGKLNQKTGGSVSYKVGGDFLQGIQQNCKLEAQQTISIKGLSIKLEASTGIELKCGGSSIVLTPGAIFIQGGPLININSGGGPPVGPVAASPGTPAAPDDPNSPEDPDPADNAEPGYVADVWESRPSNESTDSSDIKTPAAAVLKQASEDGTPFCEECEKARQQKKK